MKRLYYSIREVCDLVSEEQHTLRYWEKEFEELKPKKNRGGNRIYSTRDLLVIKLIKKMLRDDKLSLKGAKEQLHRFLHSTDERTILNRLEKEVSKNTTNQETENASFKQFSVDELKEIQFLLKNILNYLKKS